MLLIGYTVSLFVTGMTEPFLVIFLHQVRGMTLGIAGIVIAASGIAGVVAIPVAGWIGDRFGTRQGLMIMLIISAAGQTGLAITFHPEWAFVASFLTGAGAAGSWNALSTMLVEFGKAHRNDIFGVAYGLQNLGSGVGAAVGGFILDPSFPISFVLVFLLDAATFLLFAGVGGWLSKREARPGKIYKKPADEKFRGNYRIIFKDRRLVVTSILYALFAVTMTALSTTAFPQWATGPAGSSTHVVGLSFLANSSVIVCGQLFVLRLIAGRRRTRAVSSTALLLGLGCLLILFAGTVGGRVLTTVGFIFAWMLIGFGETLLFPSLPALVNDLASDRLRGRYNAVFNLSWQVGSIAGPPITGWTLGNQWGPGCFSVLWLYLVC